MIPTPTSCPVLPEPFDLQDLEPLLAALQANSLPPQTIQFPAGSLGANGSLDLCKQNLGAAGCAYLVQNLRSHNLIHTLLLGTNAIGDEGAARVAELIACGHLESVYLGCNLIGAAGLEHLTNALRNDQKVRALWLKRNPIGATGLRLISQMLESNTTLRTLDVVNTSPDHASMLELLGVIATHPSLEYVYLSGNGLDTAEAPALAQCLEQNKLRGLYLSVNHLGDTGATQLAAALQRNSSLEFLSLASNGIGDAGVIALAEAARQHPSLVSLDLGYAPSTKALGAKPNAFGQACVPSILELLRANCVLQDLNVTPNQFDEASKQAMLEVARTLKRLSLGVKYAVREATPTHLDAQRIRSVYR